MHTFEIRYRLDRHEDFTTDSQEIEAEDIYEAAVIAKRMFGDCYDITILAIERKI